MPQANAQASAQAYPTEMEYNGAVFDLSRPLGRAHDVMPWARSNEIRPGRYLFSQSAVRCICSVPYSAIPYRTRMTTTTNMGHDFDAAQYVIVIRNGIAFAAVCCGRCTLPPGSSRVEGLSPWYAVPGLSGPLIQWVPGRLYHAAELELGMLVATSESSNEFDQGAWSQTALDGRGVPISRHPVHMREHEMAISTPWIPPPVEPATVIADEGSREYRRRASVPVAGMASYSDRINILREHVAPFRYYGVEVETERPTSGDPAPEYNEETDEWSSDESVASSLSSIAAEIVEASGNKVLCKDDGSLEYGIEIVSRPATVAEHRGDEKTEEAHRVRWDDISRVLYDRSVITTSRCGLHVHIDSRAMSRLTRGKLIVMLNTDNREMRNKIERIARRGANRYCEPVAKKNCADMPQSRYEPVNITNFGTVEIRIFRSSRRPHWIKACVEFCDALVRYLPGCSVKHLERWDLFEDWLFANRAEFPLLVPYLNAQGALDNPARFVSKSKDARACA